MTNNNDWDQESWLKYEKEREKRREKILARLREENAASALELADKALELESAKKKGPAYENEVKRLTKELKEIRSKIETNKELMVVLAKPKADPDKYRHGDLVDKLLDKTWDSHGGDFEGSRTDALPFGGIGATLLLQLREAYYEMKEEEKGNRMTK